MIYIRENLINNEKMLFTTQIKSKPSLKKKKYFVLATWGLHAAHLPQDSRVGNVGLACGPRALRSPYLEYHVYAQNGTTV